jgi:hypothetical protein
MLVNRYRITGIDLTARFLDVTQRTSTTQIVVLVENKKVFAARGRIEVEAVLGFRSV